MSKFFILFFYFFLIPINVFAQRIFLDSGHTLNHPGSIGTCGTPEVFVNDAVTDKLAKLLVSSGYQISISRLLNFESHRISPQPGRETTAELRARTEKANRFNADLFISIHHDSVGEEFLNEDPLACPGQKTLQIPLRITDDFLKQQNVGFNIFFTRDNDRQKINDSLKLASLIGQGFVDANEVPSDYHIAPIENCDSCRFENKKLGVLSRNLLVTRTPTMPAVLIEITNLKDPDMEKNL